MRSRYEGIWPVWAGGFLCAFLILMPLSATVGPPHLNLQWSDLAALGFLVTSAMSGVWWGQGSRAVSCWAALYVGSLLPSLTQTAHLMTSFVELVKTVYLVCLSLAMWRWIEQPPAWDRLARVFAAIVGMMILLTLGVWLYAVWSSRVPMGLAVNMAVPNVGEVVRVKATLYTPTLLANYLTMGVPMLAGYVAAHAPWPRATGWGVLLAGLLAAGTTASHSVAGCLVAAALVAPRTAWWDRVGQRCLSLLAVAAVLFSLVATTVAVHDIQTASAPAASQPASLADHEFAGPSGTGEELTVQVHYTWVVYGILKRLAWEAWQRHPWIGIGLGEFPHEVTKAFEGGRIHSYYAAGHNPHSTWFGILAETGLLGLAGLMGLWIALLRAGARANARTAQSAEHWGVRAAFAGLIGLLVNSVHVDVMHFRFLWVGMALVLAAAQWSAANPRPAMAGARS